MGANTFKVILHTTWYLTVYLLLYFCGLYHYDRTDSSISIFFKTYKESNFKYTYNYIDIKH
jgi:hypothetical protein